MTQHDNKQKDYDEEAEAKRQALAEELAQRELNAQRAYHNQKEG